MLLPLEDSCRQNYTERQIDFWVDWFATERWTRPEILDALRFLLGECKFLPTAADWLRVRPSRRDSTRPVDEPLAATTERLAATAPTSWARFVMTETTKGLKARDMPTVYDRIIAEGERRKIDPAEIARFRQAKIETLEVRDGSCRVEQEAKDAERRRRQNTHTAIERATNA